jgi:hypothetical protein
MKKITLLLSALCFSIFVTAQDCEVLLETISTSYEGDCKKGLAHGEGTAKGEDQYIGEFKKGFPHGEGKYIWADGKTYEGEWSNGKMDGEGVMNMIVMGKDSVLTGFWKDNVYVGEELLPEYKIIQQRSVDDIRITKVGEGKSEVIINFVRLGSRNNDIQNLQTQSSKGPGYMQNGAVVFDEIDFPFTGGVTYRTSNKLKTAMVDVRVQFVINYPGRWKVDISN